MTTRGSTQCMSDCNHEEADTRIIVHLQDAIANGGPVTALIRTVDTDVVVILIGKFFNLKRINQNVQIWVAFGMGKSFRYLSINGICAALGEQKSRALPMFQAFCGCDTTSAFNGKGKQSSWRDWSLYGDIITASLEYLSAHPFQELDLNSPHFQSLERLTVVMSTTTVSQVL